MASNNDERREITEVITNFVHAAKRAKSADFDGAEPHGANGYLLDEFLTDYTNQRTDEYGGSTKNRVRLLAEVPKAIREAESGKTLRLVFEFHKENQIITHISGPEKNRMPKSSSLS